MGQIIKVREYPDASFTSVTAPNADTLYTTSFFDVGKEPWVLSLPDMKDRYAPAARRLDQRLPGPGQADDRNRRANLCDYWPGMDRNVAAGCQGIQVGDQHGMADWPHLLHRHS
jgi:hypothetical protein